MKFVKPMLLATIATVALAASAGLATARSANPNPPRHTLTVRAPDGSVARISYSGDVAPVVHFEKAPAAAFAPGWSFANIARMSATMNREMDVLLRQADMLSSSPLFGTSPFYNTVLLHPMGPEGRPVPKLLQTSTAPGMCMQSVEVSQVGNGTPHVVEHLSGNCGRSAMPAAALLPRNGKGHLVPLAPAAAGHAPQIHEVRYLPR